MTHHELLIWLKPRLDDARDAGLEGEGVDAIREKLQRMRKAGALRPFASRLLTLVRERSTLDAAMVADLADELRYELSPPREQTMLLSALRPQEQRDPHEPHDE
jgi:hypothetical protein